MWFRFGSPTHANDLARLSLCFGPSGALGITLGCWNSYQSRVWFGIAVGTNHPHSFACECCSRTFRGKASPKCTGVASEKYFSGKKNELGRRHPNSQSYQELCFSLTKKPLTKLHVCSFLLPHAVAQICNYVLPMRLCSYAPQKLPKSSIS